MRLLLSFLLVSFSFYIGYTAGRGFSRIDIETFDAQARVIRDLSRRLSELEPDNEYHLIE